MSTQPKSGQSGDQTRLERFIENPRRAVWTVSAPMMAGLLVHVLYHVADTAFVGRLGPASLAGITLVFPLFLVLVALANGVGSGIGVVVAQSIGRNEPGAAACAGGTATTLGLGLGLVFALVGLIGGPLMLSQLGGTGRVADEAWAYFAIIAAAAPLTLVGSFFRAMLVGQGDTRTPMYVLLFSSLLNLALDPLLIFTFGLGIRGAAYATVTAQMCTTLALSYLVLFSPRTVVRLRATHLRPQWTPIRRVLALGAPATLSQLIMAFGSMAMNRVVASFGDSALAGFGAAGRIDAVVALPILGLAAGTVTVVGMFAGAGRSALVRDTTLYVFRWALLISTALGVSAFLTREAFLSIFTADPETIAVGSHYLGFMLFVYPLMGVGMVGGRLLLGLGYAHLSLSVTALRLLVIAVPVAYISVYLYNGPLAGVWWGILAGAAASTLVSLTLIYRLMWHGDPTARAVGAQSAAPATR